MHEAPTGDDVPPYTWITDPAGIAALGQRCAQAAWIALDSESNSRFVYRERICLIQLNIEGELILIDPLALGEGKQSLEPLRAALADPAIPVFLHGGEYDVACLKRDYGIALGGVRDTQQAALLLGLPSTGYGAVVGKLLGIDLEKGHSLYNWATRPLAAEALRYALDDVLHLGDLSTAITARIAAADLDEEWAIANTAVEAVDAHRSGYDPVAIWRIKGIGQLPAAQLALLAGLHRWRDAVAEHCDRPAGMLLHPEALLALARQAPSSVPHLRSIRLPGRFLREHGEALVAEIKRLRAEPVEVTPPPARREVDPAERGREQRLKDWRRREAERRETTLQAVLPARALEHLVRHPDADLAEVPQLGDKRRRLYGEQLRQICQG